MANPGASLSGGNRLSALLQNQPNYNNGTALGGLAHVLQQYMAGRGVRQDSENQQGATDAYVQGMSAQPWVNPDTGEVAPAGSAGGQAGAMAALQGQQNNPYARNLAMQLMMEQAQTQGAEQQWQSRFDAQNQAQDARFDKQSAAQDARLREQLAAQERIAGMRQSNAPSGYQVRPDGSGLEPIAGGPADPNAPKPQKPLPTAALKLVREDQEALMTVDTLNSQLGQFSNLISEGKLNLGTFGNMASNARNYMGASDENSRNFASMKAMLEKMRNDSLRLNNGVQTEGDAQRAWNELIANINDEELVKQRMAEIAKLNSRAADIRRANIELVYSNFGIDPMQQQMGQTPPAMQVPPAGGNIPPPPPGFQIQGE